jgi:hypothetical protein
MAKTNDADVAADRHRRCFRTSSEPLTVQCSLANATRNSRRNSSDRMRPDKKLGNVLAPFAWSRDPSDRPSYSDLYRRRLG